MNLVKIANRIINLDRVDRVDLGETPDDPVTFFFATTYEDKKTTLLVQTWERFSGPDADEARRSLVTFAKKPKELRIAGEQP